MDGPHRNAGPVHAPLSSILDAFHQRRCRRRLRSTSPPRRADQVAAAADRAKDTTAEWVRTTAVAAASGRDLAREVAHLEAEVRRLQAEILRRSTALGQHVDAIGRAGLVVWSVGDPPWRLDLVRREN